MKVGMIGFGRRMNVMLKAIRQAAPECALAAVADPRIGDVREQWRQGGGSAETQFYEDADRMLAAGGLDGIMIGTRCSLHADMALKAMPLGVPIFLEKPVATTLDDLLRLKRGCEETKAPVLVSFPLRMTPIVQLAKQLVDAGTIGTVEHVQAVNNVAYGSTYFKGWYRDEKETGGLFLQKATHDFDVINYLVGLRPVAVSAMGSKRIFKGTKPAGLRCADCGEADRCPDRRHAGDYCCYAVDTGNDDSASALIRYESGMHAVYSQNFFVRGKAGRRSVRLMGYKGTIEFDYSADTLRVLLHHSPVVQTYNLDYAKEPHFGGDRALAEHYADMMRSGSASLASLDDGMLSALMCLKAKQSALESRFMDIGWTDSPPSGGRSELSI